MQGKSTRISLKRRLTSLFILASLITVGFLTTQLTNQLRSKTRHMLQSQEQAILSYIATDIDTKLKQRMTLLNQNAELLTQYINSPKPITNFLAQRIGLQALFRGGLVVLDNQGIGIAEFPARQGYVGHSFAKYDDFIQSPMARQLGRL